MTQFENTLIEQMQQANVSLFEMRKVDQQAFEMLATGVAVLVQGFDELIDNTILNGLKNAKPAPKEKEEKDTGNGLAEVFGKVQSVIGTVVDTIQQAIGKVVSTIQQVVQAATYYVSFLNPSLVQAFDRAMKDLNAVFGVALTSIVTASTQYLRMVGSILLPVMSQLEPIVARLSSAFLQLLSDGMPSASRLLLALVPLADALMRLLEALMPFIQTLQSVAQAVLSMTVAGLRLFVTFLNAMEAPLKSFAEWISGLIPVFEGLAAFISGVVAVLQPVFAALMSLFSGAQGDTKGFRSAMETLAKYALLAGSYLAKMLGVQEAYIKGIQDAFADAVTQDDTGLAAIQSTSFQDFAAFGKNVALEASKANGASPELTKEERDKAWQESVLTELEQSREGQDALSRIIDDGLTRLEEIIEKTVENIKKDISAVPQGLVKKAVRQAAGPFGRLLPE